MNEEKMTALMLSRKMGERVRLRVTDGPAEGLIMWVEVVAASGPGRVRLRIAAPSCVEILRAERIADPGQY
jgi:sRNA-binding carbon storage regulator CsrA